jgi:hypothetical protein
MTAGILPRVQQLGNDTTADRLAAVDAILEALPGGERRHGLRGNADFLAVETSLLNANKTDEPITQ